MNRRGSNVRTVSLLTTTQGSVRGGRTKRGKEGRQRSFHSKMEGVSERERNRTTDKKEKKELVKNRHSIYCETVTRERERESGEI